VNCKVCEHDHFDLIIEREFPKHVICRNCGFTFMEAIKSLHEYYEDDYWDSFHGIKGIQDLNMVEVPPRCKEILATLSSYLKDDTNCLEIGAGFGFTLHYIRRNSKCKMVFGLEPSKDGCKSMEYNQIPCFQGSLEQFNVNEKFDVIILSHVFEHFQDPELATTLIKKLLSPGGIIYVEVPNLLSPEFHKNLKFWFSKEHFFYYSQDKLNYFLQKAGYRRVYKKSTSVLRTIFVVSSEKIEPRYSNEYMKVKLSLLFHEVMYYPARLIRMVSKKLFK
jgi:SAM-dependent methyltransferase